MPHHYPQLYMCGANLNSVLHTCAPRVFHLALLLLLPPPAVCGCRLPPVAAQQL